MSELGSFIKRLRDIMRNDAGINGDAQRIEQIAWMLFLHVYDAKEDDWAVDDENYVSIIPEECRWRNWAHDDKSGKAMTGDKLLDFVNNTLFPTLKGLQVSPDTPIKKAIVTLYVNPCICTGYFLLPNNHIQYLFCERDNNSTCQGQKPVRSLTRVMRLQRQAYLHDAKSKQNQSDGSDQAEDEVGQIVDCLNRIPCRIADAGSDRKAQHSRHIHHKAQSDGTGAPVQVDHFISVFH